MEHATADNEMNVFPRLADSRRVLVVALIKLLVDGFLFYLVLYGPLHKAGAFGYLASDYDALCRTLRGVSLPVPGYALYFALGLFFASVLYLYTVYIIDVRRKVSYLLYAGFLGIDVCCVLDKCCVCGLCDSDE